MSNNINRIKALISRFEDEKNEELFPICTSQIVKLYRQEPGPLHLLIFETIRNLLVSKKTYKRLVSAALFEKLIDEVHEGVSQASFVFSRSDVDFDPRVFVESLEKTKKEKTRNEINFEHFVNEDLFKNTQEYVKGFLVKKDNFLYSKSEKAIQAKEKASKGAAIDERQIIEQLNEELMKNENTEFGAKKQKPAGHKEHGPASGGHKRVKEGGVSGGLVDLASLATLEHPTSVFDLVYQLARYLVFHPNWEMRHGALLIFRAVARKFDRLLSFDAFLDPQTSGAPLTVELDEHHRIRRTRGRLLKDTAAEINEDVKQKCFILLALDRFSDFLADKSNMTNRALGAEVLVILFLNIGNLERFYFIFEFLFLQNVKNGWEPKQALVFLAKKILEADVQKPEGAAPLIPGSVLKRIADAALKIADEHEEISETCAMFFQTLARQPLEGFSPNFFRACEERLLGCLMKTEDISYLPKSVFELLSTLLETGQLSPAVLEPLEELIRKFLFHENNEVRTEIFRFISELLAATKAGRTGFRLTDQLLKFFYLTVLFYHLIHKREIFEEKEKEADRLPELLALEREETRRVLRILADITAQLASPGLRDQLFGVLFKVLEEKNFDSAIAHLNVKFSYNIQKSLDVDYYGILELLVRFIGDFEAAEARRVFELMREDARRNSLVYIPFFFADGAGCAALAGLAEQVLETAQGVLSVPFFDANLREAIDELEVFIATNTVDINLAALPALEKTVLDLVLLLDKKEEVKDNLVTLHNLLIQLCRKLKESIELGQVPLTKHKLWMAIEGQLLPRFWKLYDFAKKFVLLLRCSAANRSLQAHLDAGSLPKANGINNLVKPFLDIFSESLPGFFAEHCSGTLFKLVRVYAGEAKHPNLKIVANLIRRAEGSPVFRENTKSYFARLFAFLGPAAFASFPELAEILNSQCLSAAFIDILLSVLSPANDLAFGDAVMDRIESGAFSAGPQLEAIYSELFGCLGRQMLAGRAVQMSRFMTMIFRSLARRDAFAFRVLNVLLDNHKTDFISYAKVFLNEVIRAINEALEFDKAPVYEAFSKILTLAYIDLEQVDLGLLDPLLFREYERGRLFLFEFRNNKNFSIDLSPVLNPKLRAFSLREYQIEGIKWLFFLFKHGLSACLCDDMGLGKTIQALCALGVLHSFSAALNPEERPVSLIVCPNNLLPHWARECETYIDGRVLSPAFLMAGDLSEAFPLSAFLRARAGASLLVTSYNAIARIDAFMDVKFKAVVLDEAHLIKNDKSATAVRVKTLRAEVRLALTGTPIQNNVTELWSIFDFLMPLYLSQKDVFRREFKSLMDMSFLSLDMKKMELSEGQARVLEGLHKKVLPFIMRREKGEVLRELPDKIIQDFACELTPSQAKLYEVFERQNFSHFIDESIAEGGRAEGRGGPENGVGSQEVIKRSFFVVLSAMRKILNHPSLLPLHYLLPASEKEKGQREKKARAKPERPAPADPLLQREEELFMLELGKRESLEPFLRQLTQTQDPDFFYRSGKFVATKELLNTLGFFEEDPLSCIDNGNKLLVFTRSNETLALLQRFFAERFPFLKTLALTRAQTQFQRADVVDQFNGSAEIKLLLLTPKIGGLGLNLTSANIVVMFDHDFNPMNDLQAMDRAHRIGQKNTVNVFRLVTQRTLEEKIMGIQKFKLTVANTVINTENASISNVKDSNFIGFLETFANENIAKKEEKELEQTFGSYSKYLKETDLEQMWNEDEYDKEFV